MLSSTAFWIAYMPIRNGDTGIEMSATNTQCQQHNWIKNYLVYMVNRVAHLLA